MRQNKEYTHVGLGYSHQMMFDRVEPGSRVLEVGCATGYMTQAMKEDLGCEVTVVEINPELIRQAQPYAKLAVVGDIEDSAVWNELGSGYDAVVFGDVLEHLKDPWDILRRSHDLLNNDGKILASIPNVAYYEVRFNLLLGRFEYTSLGILDNTHLRFFTASSVMRLFEDTGYRIAKFDRVYKRARHRILSKFVPNLVTFQFVIEAVADDSQTI
ncbi:MAG: class I SAM-dependent methyltransferase [Armatimonadota bacterium]|nr:class I SAM-dependent methyltransferase [bacterium]